MKTARGIYREELRLYNLHDEARLTLLDSGFLIGAMFALAWVRDNGRAPHTVIEQHPVPVDVLAPLRRPA